MSSATSCRKFVVAKLESSEAKIRELMQSDKTDSFSNLFFNWLSFIKNISKNRNGPWRLSQ